MAITDSLPFFSTARSQNAVTSDCYLFSADLYEICRTI